MKHFNLKTLSVLRKPFGFFAIVFGYAVCTGLSGCSSIEPWVKPYERSHLADPIMSLDRLGIAGSYMHHVYQAREASRGAEGGAGGGCGCN